MRHGNGVVIDKEMRTEFHGSFKNDKKEGFGLLIERVKLTKAGQAKLLTFHRNLLKNESTVTLQSFRKMIHRKLKAKDFEELWKRNSRGFGRSQTEPGQAGHSFLSREQKIQVTKEPRVASLGGSRLNSGGDSWIRSNYTTGEGGKIDTFSLLEFEDDLTVTLRQKVKEKKMQEWEMADVELFLREIGMGKSH